MGVKGHPQEKKNGDNYNKNNDLIIVIIIIIIIIIIIHAHFFLPFLIGSSPTANSS